MTMIGGAIGLVLSTPSLNLFEAMFSNTHVHEASLYFLVPVVIVAVATIATYAGLRASIQ